MPAAKKTDPAPVVEHPTLAAALAAFQAEVPNVHKSKTADTGKYKYKYADLADVASAAYPVLARHGLSFTARPEHVEGVGFVLVGVLRHASGETDEGTLPIQGRDAQAIGSSLTYNRRYLLGCMTGIVTDEDDDGQRARDARDARPRSDVRPSQNGNGARQNGRAPAPAPEPADHDPAVVKAHTIAATKAADLMALKSAYDEAAYAGTLHAQIPDPDGEQGTFCTLAEFITRRKAALAA